MTTSDQITETKQMDSESIDLNAVYKESDVESAIALLDEELVGLAPVKTRVSEIASLLVVEKLRNQVGLQAEPPSLHMSFTGNPGTGKTTVALRMADILKKLDYVRKGHLVACTRDDLVGEFIGHTAPKTREMIKKAMGGVLFIDEAYFLYRPENERDYGKEAIEILLQAMEDHRDDFVVILAGYEKEMDKFFGANPGMASRVAHHIDFPDYDDKELEEAVDRFANIMTLLKNSLNETATNSDDDFANAIKSTEIYKTYEKCFKII